MGRSLPPQLRFVRFKSFRRPINFALVQQTHTVTTVLPHAAIITNYGGQLITLTLALIFVPAYIRILGVEAYGLIGFYITLNGAAAIFDLGISATINRELARAVVERRPAEQVRDLVRTLEICYWAIGIAIGGIICLFAPQIARYWLKSGSVPLATVTTVVRMMGVILALQWPLTFYQGGLIGLQRQVTVNAIQVAAALFRYAGVLLVLIIAPNITAFFAWQILTSAVQVVIIRSLTWILLPCAPVPAGFRIAALRQVAGFTGGMAATTFVTFLLSQSDKILLSKVLPLREFGYYMLALSLNNAFRMLGPPIASAMFPRFSALAAERDSRKIMDLFRTASQLVSVVVIPTSLVGAVFATQIIGLWIGDPNVTDQVAPIARVLIIGSALNNLMGLPYDLTIAFGWTRLGLYQNAISLVIIVPLLIALTARFGALGAGFTWCILNLGYFLIVPRIVFSRLLPGALRQWYKADIGVPLVVSFVAVVAGRLLLPHSSTHTQTLLTLTVASGMTLAGSIMATKLGRSWIRGVWTRYL